MAVSVSRSATPWNEASSPIGSSSGATPAPNTSRSLSRVRSKPARSRVEVGRRRAVLHATEPVDGARAVQQRLGERRLPSPSVTDECDVADLGGREALHEAPRFGSWPAVGGCPGSRDYRGPLVASPEHPHRSNDVRRTLAHQGGP